MGTGKALFVQHDPDVGPAMLADAFTDAGYAISVVRVDVALPDPRDLGVIVALGSDSSVYDPALVAGWVGTEMDYLRDADAAGVPVLGVCFGGQLLAQAHGGTVGPAVSPEIGWCSIDTDDPRVVPAGPWFQWHSDRWTLPPGATEIARNDNASQAFLLRRSLAVQFHPELDSALLDEWLVTYPNPAIGAERVDTERLVERSAAEQCVARVRVRALVSGFLDSVSA